MFQTDKSHITLSQVNNCPFCDAAFHQNSLTLVHVDGQLVAVVIWFRAPETEFAGRDERTTVVLSVRNDLYLRGKFFRFLTIFIL